MSITARMAGGTALQVRMSGSAGAADAVMYTPQTLTDEQRAQARKNIAKYQYDWREVVGYGGTYIIGDFGVYYGTPSVDLDGAMNLSSVVLSKYSAIGSLHGCVHFFINRIDIRSIATTWMPRIIRDYEAIKEAGLLVNDTLSICEQGGLDGEEVCIAYSISSTTGGDYTHRISFVETSNSRGATISYNVETDEYSISATMPSSTDTSLTLPNSAADAKVVGDALAEKITTPSTASVGQTIMVKAVDEDGKPTEWEAVDFPEAIELPDALPNPNALTFTGAVSATYDGSEAVSVEIPSGGSGEGSAESDELLLDFASTEEVTQIELPLTGLASKINNAAQLKLYVHITLPSADDGTDLGYLTASIFRTWTVCYFFRQLQKSPSNAYNWMTYSKILTVMTKSKDGVYQCFSGGAVKNDTEWSGDNYAAAYLDVADTDRLILTSSLPMGVGTVVRLYARGTL